MLHSVLVDFLFDSFWFISSTWDDIFNFRLHCNFFFDLLKQFSCFASENRRRCNLWKKIQNKINSRRFRSIGLQIALDYLALIWLLCDVSFVCLVGCSFVIFFKFFLFYFNWCCCCLCISHWRNKLGIIFKIKANQSQSMSCKRYAHRSSHTKMNFVPSKTVNEYS